MRIFDFALPFQPKAKSWFWLVRSFLFFFAMIWKLVKLCFNQCHLFTFYAWHENFWDPYSLRSFGLLWDCIFMWCSTWMVQKLISFLLHSFVFNNFLVFFLFVFFERYCDFFLTRYNTKHWVLCIFYEKKLVRMRKGSARDSRTNTLPSPLWILLASWLSSVLLCSC